MLNQASVTNVKWSVIWRKRGKWIRKRFGDDLDQALKFFLTKISPVNMHPTLHSDNVGFPPPRRITHHEHIHWKVVERGGKKYKVKVTTTVNLMVRYNEKGVWWCPYCVMLRPFKLIQTERGAEMYCPVCQITNYDFHVRRANPKAIIVEQHKRQRRTRARRRSRRRPK